MVIFYSKKNGKILAAFPDALQLASHIQVTYENEPMLEQCIIDGKTAYEYNDPRKPHFNIHNCHIEKDKLDPSRFTLHDPKNNRKHLLKKDHLGIGRLDKTVIVK